MEINSKPLKMQKESLDNSMYAKKIFKRTSLNLNAI